MDEYARADLKAHLESLPPQGRIEFVKTLGDVRWMPDAPRQALTEILAADDSVAVRAWAARTLGFDKFKDDENPFVRAAWRESTDTGMIPTFLHNEDAIEEFSKLSSLERCGWIRSATFPRVLLEIIFDCKDERFSLSHADRQWLIAAFLTGQRYPVGPRRGSRFDVYDPDFALGDKLWRHAAAWPIPHYKELRAHVFEHVDASDDGRIEILAALKDRDSRHAIVRSAASHSKCLKGALEDDDDEVRGHAWARYHFQRDEWRMALDGFDLVALRGLCRNKSLSATVRVREVTERLRSLGDEEGASREGFLLRDRADQEERGRQSRGRSVDARLDLLQASVDRMRLQVRIIFVVAVACVILALGRVFL